MTEHTVKALVSWILVNRRKDAFKDYPPNKIASEIKEAVKQNVFVISHRDGFISGIACGERDDQGKRIIIHDVLTTKPGIVKEFILYCFKLYPDYTIHGVSPGKLRTIHNPLSYARRIK